MVVQVHFRFEICLKPVRTYVLWKPYRSHKMVPEMIKIVCVRTLSYKLVQDDTRGLRRFYEVLSSYPFVYVHSSSFKNYFTVFSRFFADVYSWLNFVQVHCRAHTI